MDSLQQALERLLGEIDTRDLPEIARKVLAPVDSALMWNKVRQTPGGEDLYQMSPSPVAPFVKGLKNWWGAAIQTGEAPDLNPELANPANSIMGRYAIHIPFVDPQGVQSPHGLQLQTATPDISWLTSTMRGQPAVPNITAQHTNLAGAPWGPNLNAGMIDMVASEDPWNSPRTLIQHETGGHGTVDLLTGDVPPAMSQKARELFYRYLPLAQRQEVQSSPNPAQTVGEKLLEGTPKDAPAWSNYLRSNPGYADVPEPVLGNEILAHINAQQNEDSPDLLEEQRRLREDPWRKSFYLTARDTVNPRAFREPGSFTWDDVRPWITDRQ